MKVYLIGLLFILASFVNAQIPEEEYMDPQSVLGIWESADSAKWKIEFLFHQNRFILASDTTPAGRHQFNAYEFFPKDSSSVSTSGVIILWPPYYCEVKLLDADNIEIKYSVATGGDVVTVNYRRVPAKK